MNKLIHLAKVPFMSIIRKISPDDENKLIDLT